MFVRKAATVVAGTLLALGLAVTPAAAAEPLAQPAAASAQAGLGAPSAWHESLRFPTEQACNSHRYEAAKRGARTGACTFKKNVFSSGGYWSYVLWY